MEKVYKTMRTTGSICIVLGIISIIVGVVTGIISIVCGAKLLTRKDEVVF